jgi:hypothetical protein
MSNYCFYNNINFRLFFGTDALPEKAAARPEDCSVFDTNTQGFQGIVSISSGPFAALPRAD